MNNLSDIRKQFAKVYGTPAGNCKNTRRELFLKGIYPILAFFTCTCILAGMMIANALVSYFPSFFKFFGVASVFLIILLAFGAYFLNKFLNKSESDMTAYDIGIEGENAVAAELNFLLPDFSVFHSVKLPNYDFDIDHIVLSPYGIIIIETKKWNTSIKFENGKLVYDMEKYKRNPVLQLQDQAIKIKEYLQDVSEDKNLWIQGVICFVGQPLEGFPEDRIDKIYYVTNELKLLNVIEGFRQYGKPLSEKTLGSIGTKLKDLIAKPA